MAEKEDKESKKVLNKLEKEAYRKWRKNLEDIAINFYSDLIKNQYDIGEIIYIVEFLKMINFEKMQNFIERKKIEAERKKPNPMVI